HYTTAEYENACRIIREAYDLPSINTDIIVGFPGETEEEFEETLAFAEKTGFAKIHIFKYSRRKGTLADKLPDQIDESVKNARSARLQEIDSANHRKYISQFIGKRVRILTEQEESVEDVKSCSGNYMTGLTERYVKVAVPTEGLEQNRFVECDITGITGNGILMGTVVKA
ncbi:MAG: tRNA (N(6)-L-threonylcarbamoyladenosine(37)-C(2))-methylthiotransferase MtaB, partial [Lachnospiraceae bacterium]|nr:tRNA (N(6)-L-threonylcarbamoyladenosine(37)-C(2))-methylthiotransferase MtaB [Lachnospiraceae bacterium]